MLSSEKPDCYFYIIIFLKLNNQLSSGVKQSWRNMSIPLLNILTYNWNLMQILTKLTSLKQNNNNI